MLSPIFYASRSRPVKRNLDYSQLTCVWSRRGSMGKDKAMVGLELDRKLLERAETWRRSQEFIPTKTAMLEAALREFLDRREAAQSPRSTSPTKNSSGKR